MKVENKYEHRNTQKKGRDGLKIERKMERMWNQKI